MVEDLLKTLDIKQIKSKGDIEKNRAFIEKILTGEKKPKILQTSHGLVNVGKKWFKPEYSTVKHKWIFVEINKAKLDEKIKKIITKLKPALDPELILKESLLDMPLVEIQKLHENLFKAKRKAKPKQREGCVEIKVGDVIIPIR